MRCVRGQELAGVSAVVASALFALPLSLDSCEIPCTMLVHESSKARSLRLECACPSPSPRPPRRSRADSRRPSRPRSCADLLRASKQLRRGSYSLLDS